MASTSLFRHFGPSRLLRRHGDAWQRGELDLQAIPPALRALDSGFEAEWRSEAFALAGYSIPIGKGSPFAVAQAPAAWVEALHGFAWLRHVAPQTDEDALRVETALWDWLKIARGRTVAAQQDGVTARRILSWLAHADVLLQTSDAAFYDAVLNALKGDIVTLERRAGSIESAGERLLALIALAQAGLCIEKASGLQHAAENAIGEEFTRHGWSLRQFLRKPDDVADLMLDLEALRLLYGMQGQTVPHAITHAKDVLASVLGGLMLDGDCLARLGAARVSTERSAIMASLARHVSIASSAACHNTDAGFVRLALGDTRAVADVGAPFRSVDALALEICSGGAPMLVHDGLETRMEGTARGTLLISAAQAAAESGEPRRNMPTLEPALSVEVDVDNSAIVSFDATHAGAALNGHAHRRRVVLSEEGFHIDGIDELRPMVGRADAAVLRFALRFVLHPSAQATLGASPDQLELTLANGHRWRFVAGGRTISVEGAVHRDGMRTTPTLQILVPADTESSRSVAWHWLRLDTGATD